MSLNSSVITVIGKGPESNEMISGDVMIRFNCEKASQILISNRVLAVNNGHGVKTDKSFFSNGMHASLDLNDHLATVACKLEQELGCWPSSGYTVIRYLLLNQMTFTVVRMPLLPSLERAEGLGIKKPLSCIFHNWLGERRHVFISPELSNWQSLFLPTPQNGSQFSKNPFNLLFDVANQTKSESALNHLKKLAEIDKSCWLSHATPEVLEAAEPLFYIDRAIRKTKNWWLFDFNGSFYANQIFRNLAWCQQSIFV